MVGSTASGSSDSIAPLSPSQTSVRRTFTNTGVIVVALPRRGNRRTPLMPLSTVATAARGSSGAMSSATIQPVFGHFGGEEAAAYERVYD
jgi:hypothetical protein